MERREFIAGAGVLLANCHMPRVSPTDDTAAVKEAVAAVYATYYNAFNKERYRALLAEDYLLLENGEILDREGDIALMPTPESGYQRTDAFDFRSVTVQENIAYAVYFLTSDIKDEKGSRNRKWLESAIFRRAGKGWRMALLHSTRITTPAG